MKCKKCGAEVPAGMKFCGECGTAIPQIIKCASCGADIEAGMKFCGNCGAPVSQKKKCISCGAEISYNLKFCPECGANQSQVANNVTPAKPSVTPSKPEEPITMVENLELKKAREQFFACDGNLSEILKTAESLWKAHSTNEDVLSLYLAALAAGGKEIEAFKVIEGLGKGILSTYISAIDILLTKEELAEVEKWLRKASVIFPDNNVLKCYEVYYNLKLYKKYNDFSFLENATNANASLKNVNGPLELSHQLRVMSLLQVESGEEPPAYDKDFCKENNLYFRIVSNLKLGGVYVEGVASEYVPSAVAGNADTSKDYIYKDSGTERTVRFYQAKEGMGGYKYICIISRPTPSWVDPEESDYLIAYSNDGNLELACYNSDDWDEDEEDEMREQEKADWISTFTKYVLCGKQVAPSEVDFFTEDSVSKKIDDQIERVLTYEKNDDWDFISIIPLQDLDGAEYKDINGTFCFMDTSRIQVGKNSNGEFIFALPVKKMLETGTEWSDGGEVSKIPFFYEGKYKGENLEGIEFNNYLRCAKGWKPEDANGLYLLNKDGKRITSLQDFDHSEPDKDGNIYYPVPGSDLVDEDSYSPLTSEATSKWKAKLGM